MTHRGLKAAGLLGVVAAAIGMLWLASGRPVSPSVGAQAPSSAPEVAQQGAAPEGASPSAHGTPAPSSSPSPSAAAVAPSEPGYEAFEKLVSQVARSLPKREELSRLSEHEAHTAPQAVTRAMESLGAVAEALAREPKLAPRALDFYRDCARGDHPSSVRALCLARANRIEGREPEWASELPDAVRSPCRAGAVLSYRSRSSEPHRSLRR